MGAAAPGPSAASAVPPKQLALPADDWTRPPTEEELAAAVRERHVPGRPSVKLPSAKAAANAWRNGRLYALDEAQRAVSDRVVELYRALDPGGGPAAVIAAPSAAAAAAKLRDVEQRSSSAGRLRLQLEALDCRAISDGCTGVLVADSNDRRRVALELLLEQLYGAAVRVAEAAGVIEVHLAQCRGCGSPTKVFHCTGLTLPAIIGPCIRDTVRRATPAEYAYTGRKQWDWLRDSLMGCSSLAAAVAEARQPAAPAAALPAPAAPLRPPVDAFTFSPLSEGQQLALAADVVEPRLKGAFDKLQLDLARQPDGSWRLLQRVGKRDLRDAPLFFPVVSWLPPWVTLRQVARTAMIQGARNSLLALDPVHMMHLTRTEPPAGFVGMDTGEPVPPPPGGGKRGGGKTKKNALAVIQCGLPGVATCTYWPANLLRLCSDRFSEAQLLQPYAAAWSKPFQLTVVLKRRRVAQLPDDEARRFFVWIESVRPAEGGLIAAFNQLNEARAGLLARLQALDVLSAWAAEQVGTHHEAANGWIWPKPVSVTTEACRLLAGRGGGCVAALLPPDADEEGGDEEAPAPEICHAASTIVGYTAALLTGRSLSLRSLAQVFNAAGRRAGGGAPTAPLHRLAAVAFWRNLHGGDQRASQIRDLGIARDFSAPVLRRVFGYAYSQVEGLDSPSSRAVGVPLLLSGLVECLASLRSSGEHAETAAAARRAAAAARQTELDAIFWRLAQVEGIVGGAQPHPAHHRYAEQRHASGQSQEQHAQPRDERGAEAQAGGGGRGPAQRPAAPRHHLALGCPARAHGRPGGQPGEGVCERRRACRPKWAEPGRRLLRLRGHQLGCQPVAGGRHDSLPQVRWLGNWLQQPQPRPEPGTPPTTRVIAFSDLGRFPGAALVGLLERNAGSCEVTSIEAATLSEALRTGTFGLVAGSLEAELAQQLTSPDWPCWSDTPVARHLRALIAEGQAMNRVSTSEFVTGNALRFPWHRRPAAEGSKWQSLQQAETAAWSRAAAQASAAAGQTDADDLASELVAPPSVVNAADAAELDAVDADLGGGAAPGADAAAAPASPLEEGIRRLINRCVQTIAGVGCFSSADSVLRDLAETEVQVPPDPPRVSRIWYDVLLRTSPSQGVSTSADFASFLIQENVAVRELFLLGLPPLPGVAMHLTTLAQLAQHYSPTSGQLHAVRVWRADCEPAMGNFMQRMHSLDVYGGAPAAAPVNGATLVRTRLDVAAAQPGSIAYVVAPECSRITCADINVVLHHCDPRLRWVFADLHAAASSGLGYLPVGFLVAGTWLNIRSRAARAIFCLHLWAGYLLPRILVRLQRTTGLWA